MVKRISIIISALVVLLVAGMLMDISSKERKHQQRMEELSKQAAVYEQERDRLLLSISKARNQTSDASSESAVLIGYLLSEEADLDFALHQGKAFGFRPVFVVDSEAGEELISAALQSGQEVVLTSYPFRMESVKEQLKRPGFSGLLIRNADETGDHLELIRKSKLPCMIRYYTRPVSVTENGMVTLGYAMVTSNSSSYLKMAEELSNGDMERILVVDMEKYHNGAFSETFLEELFSKLRSGQENGGLFFSSVKEACQQVELKTVKSEDRERAYEAYKTQTEAKIAELEAKIREIYRSGE